MRSRSTADHCWSGIIRHPTRYGLPAGDQTTQVLQDPAFEQSDGTTKGRDGCRVPLPWTTAGPSFGLGTTTPHLPQPDWFKTHSVQAQQADPGSTLNLYRQALRLRADLQGPDDLHWLPSATDVLHLVRPGGRARWTSCGLR